MEFVLFFILLALFGQAVGWIWKRLGSPGRERLGAWVTVDGPATDVIPDDDHRVRIFEMLDRAGDQDFEVLGRVAIVEGDDHEPYVLGWHALTTAEQAGVVMDLRGVVGHDGVLIEPDGRLVIEDREAVPALGASAPPEDAGQPSAPEEVVDDSAPAEDPWQALIASSAAAEVDELPTEATSSDEAVESEPVTTAPPPASTPPPRRGRRAVRLRQRPRR